MKQAFNLGARSGSNFLVIGNQERQAAGLGNIIVHDAEASIRVAVEALKKLIAYDRNEVK